jgi:polyribonucleotide nucleotidyltransferase
VLETDEKGRVKLSMKALIDRNSGDRGQPQQQPQ